MKIILKQFFKTILKKIPLMIALLFSLTIMVATASIGSFIISAISTSNNRINNDGNSSDIIFDNVTQNTEINYSGKADNIADKMITSINMNGVDPSQEEITVLPVNTSDYIRLIGDAGVNLPSWSQTAANNLNYLASKPNVLGTPFISPSALYLFRLNSVNGFHLSLRPKTEGNVEKPLPIDVFLDPRSLIFEDSSIIGFYKDFDFETQVSTPQSTMQIFKDINLFNPLSLTNSNIRRAGVHLNSNFESSFDKIDKSWTQGFIEERVLISYFEGLPNISSPIPDPKPDPNTGIPYIEKTKTAFTITLTLGDGTIENQAPLTKLYLSSLKQEERDKILNKKILMTPFQVDGKSISIPKNPDELSLFNSNLDRFIINFEDNAKNELNEKITNFTENLIHSSLDGFDWTQTQEIQATQDSTTYLFTSREMNDINKIVLELGRELFKNEENINDFKILEETNGNDKSFASMKRLVEIMVNDEMTIFDTNQNMKGNPIYPGTNVIRTVKERRLIKDILSDTFKIFNTIDNDINLNTLDPSISNGMTEREIYLLIDRNKIEAITNMPIWLEFSTIILRNLNDYSYTTSLNPRMIFTADSGLNSMDPSISSISKLNFDNYGVVVSSSHFESKKLKIVSESMINKMIISIEDAKNESITLRQDFDFNIAAKNEIDKLPNEFKILVNGQSFFINGSGDAPDFKTPIIDLSKPMPNSFNEGIIYVNISQFSVINYGSRGTLKDKTINIKSNNNSIGGVSSSISQINEKLNFEFQKIGSTNPFDIFSNNDFINFPNVSTFRWYYFDLINLVLAISFLTLSLILLVLVIYILSMIIKFIFDSLSFSIAIARANGMPRRKIIFALAIIIIGFGSLFVAFAFVISYFVTPLFFGILSGFWFVPFGLPVFPWWGIFIAIAAVTFVVGTIISILTLSTMHKPILMTLSGNDIVKINKLSGIIRSNKIRISALSKLRISMMSSKTIKISLISLVMGLSFGISVTTFSLSQKVSEAKNNNENTKQYAFSFDYIMPKYQTGLTKILSYNQLGEISEERSINTILSPPIPGADNPYYSLVYNANGDYLDEPLLAKRRVVNNKTSPNSIPKTAILNRNSGEIRTYENVILPSGYVASRFRSLDTKFLFNSIISAEILDVDIGTLLGVEIGNLWNQVSPRFPADIRLRLESNIQTYRSDVLKKYPWYSKFLIKKNPLDSNSQPVIPLKLNADIIFDKTLLRFTDEYLIVLGVFWGDEELNQENTIINFNYTANDNIKDEPYTYVNATNNVNKKNIKLIGIKNDSNYVNLKSSNGKSLNELINSNENKVIVNEGAAFANSWKVGDIININVENDYYADIKNMIEKISVKEVNFDFKNTQLEIVGISTDSIGQTFWINQDFANNLTNLDKADYVVNYSDKPIFPKPSGGNFVERGTFQKITDPSTGDVIVSVPYNGIFTRNEVPLISTVSIPMFSKTGIYPVFFDINSLANIPFLESNYEQWLELYTPPLNSSTIEIYNAIGAKSTDEFKAFLKNYFTNPDIFIKYLNNAFQDELYTPSIISLDGIAISDQIFNLTSTSSEIALITITLSFIPLLIITVMVSIISLADDFRKTMSIMRILGINKRSIIGSIILIYLPIVIIGILLGVLFSFILNIIFQALFFNVLSVFLTTSINGLIYGLSIVIMIGLMAISVLFTTIILMREKLEKSIKF